MNNLRLWNWAALAVGGAYLAACVPGLTGAPCNTNDNCPSGQVCLDGKCAEGSGGSGGGGGSGGTGGSGGGTGGGGGAGGGGNTCGANTNTDPANCGSCGNACPNPVHAAAACVGGLCGRAACQPGFFDLDGPATTGCESTCVGKTCTLPDGGTITTNNEPLPETGLVGRSIVNGSSVGGSVQTNAAHTNMGSIGEATPAVGGGLETSNAAHKHKGGFGARVK